MLFAFCSFAQPSVTNSVTTTSTKVKQVQNPAAWACPKCFNITKDGGKCANCQADKVQLGTYYCKACMKSTGDKAGKCPTCNAATVQMTRKYCASQRVGSLKTKSDSKM